MIYGGGVMKDFACEIFRIKPPPDGGGGFCEAKLGGGDYAKL